jgi:hypothetical protein
MEVNQKLNSVIIIAFPFADVDVPIDSNEFKKLDISREELCYKKHIESYKLYSSIFQLVKY